MNSLTWVLLGVGLVIAALDWVAVARGDTRLEYLAKPATMVPLIGAALALDPVDSSMRTWFVVALVCSLAGDVFLMLQRDELFVAGLGSFLVGHIAYIVGLIDGGISGWAALVGAIIVATLFGSFAPTIIKAASQTDRRLGVPVLVYVLAISVMVTLAIGSTVPVLIAGALLFYVSDFAIGWSRFVADFAAAPVVIIVTYHLAQAGLVISLAIRR